MNVVTPSVAHLLIAIALYTWNISGVDYQRLPLQRSASYLSVMVRDSGPSLPAIPTA